MAFNRKNGEMGWMYHAPSQSKSSEPVGVPPTSQIPGLSDLSSAPVDDLPKKLWIRDTDSDYIKLAKQGGRADLLRYRSPKSRSEGPQGYPRCDWYYHDDVLANEEQVHVTDDKPYDFMLPDYMVHQEWHGRRRMDPHSGNSRHGTPGSQGRVPYAYDHTNAFDRDGPNPTDKTVKLPEIRPAGYGIRAEKNSGKHLKHAPIKRTEKIVPKQELETVGKYDAAPQTNEVENPVMGKLMSHGYVQDWQDDRDNWYTKQKRPTKHEQAQHDRVQTEYQEQMQSQNRKKQETAGVASRKGDQGSTHSGRHHSEPEQEKDLFKLSKFKKVPAKTDSHRYRTNMMHGHTPIGHDFDPVEPQIASRHAQPVAM